MSTNIISTGNLLDAPVARDVNIGGKPVTVTEFRMMSDVRRMEQTSEGERWLQDDEKTHVVTVTIWNERRGLDVMRLCTKGSRVEVSGSAYPYMFIPDAEQVAKGMKATVSLRVNADSVTLAMGGLESVKRFPPREAAQT